MEHFQENPNDPTVGTPALFLTYLENSLLNGQANYEIGPAVRQTVGTSNWGESNQYYEWTTAGMGQYSELRNINEFLKWSTSSQNYIAIGKLLRSISLYTLTNVVGDAPYSQALKLTENIDKPIYDSQEDIFVAILKELDEANDLISYSGGSISGDFIYNGSIIKWKKFINSFKLRVLLSLSNKSENLKVNPKAKFAEMMNNPQKYPIFESNSDNAQRICTSSQPHPAYQQQWFYTYYTMEKSFVDSLKVRNDPRLFHYAEITDSARKAGMSISDFRAYNGLPGSAPNSQNTANYLKGSPANRNYYKIENYDPVLFLGFYEVNFLIAEGIARGWWSEGDIEKYYNAGIKASMEFYGISQPQILTYLSQPNVKFDKSNGLEMVLLQKYLGSFLNSGWEPFFSQRRTGIPIFDVSGDGVRNHRIARRWRYPDSEYLLNKENVEAAVSRQFPDGDNIYGNMWLLKE